MPNNGINDFQIAKNLNLQEFASPDTDEVKIHKRLVEICQEIRDKMKCPLCITSGYRSPEHNKKVGGAEKSYHTRGLAVDVSPIGGSLVKLFIVAATRPEVGGLGIYERHVHIDLRKSTRVFWVKIKNEDYKYFQNSISALEYYGKKLK